jgi:hypothetical protein
MTALQWIVKEAKSLKKSYPKRFTKWTDYVKQASAIYASKHKGKSSVGKKKAIKKVAVKKAAKKKVAKKKIGNKIDSYFVKKELKSKNLRLPHGYTTIKRKRVTGVNPSTHKDTKSHNVNIKVVSGISMTDAIKHSYNEMIRREKKYLDVQKNIMQENVLLINLKARLKNAKTSEQKKPIIEAIRLAKLYLSEYKTHAKELKKHI